MTVGSTYSEKIERILQRFLREGRSVEERHSELIDAGRERREHERNPRLDCVVATWKGETGPIQATECEVRDVSKTGLRLLSRVAIPDGSVVSLQDDRALIVGTVRHCDSDEHRFSIGVELLNDAYRDPPPQGIPTGPYVRRPTFATDS